MASSGPDPFLFESLRKSRILCGQLTEQGNPLAPLVDTLLFSAERSATERGEMLAAVSDLPKRMLALEHRFDERETKEIATLREGLASAMAEITAIKASREAERLLRVTEAKTDKKWEKRAKTALIITWTALGAAAPIAAYFFRIEPRTPEAPVYEQSRP